MRASVSLHGRVFGPDTGPPTQAPKAGGSWQSDEPISGARIGRQLIGLAVQAKLSRRYARLSGRQISVDAAYRVVHRIYAELLRQWMAVYRQLALVVLRVPGTSERDVYLRPWHVMSPSCSKSADQGVRMGLPVIRISNWI